MGHTPIRFRAAIAAFAVSLISIGGSASFAGSHPGGSAAGVKTVMVVAPQTAPFCWGNTCVTPSANGITVTTPTYRVFLTSESLGIGTRGELTIVILNGRLCLGRPSHPSFCFS